MQQKIVTYLIDRLAQNYEELADRAMNMAVFVFVDTRDTVSEKEWLNEIHPKAGWSHQRGRKDVCRLRATLR
jgi:hypothetical protein